MISTILSVAGGIKTLADAYKSVSTLVKGDPTERVIGELTRLNQTVERLSDNIFYAPRFQGVEDHSRAAPNLTDPRDVRDLLEPVQKALRAKIVSSAMLATPGKLEGALSLNPWTVLADIRPAHLAIPPGNPDMVPVMFAHNGMHFIGWQMRGVLPMMFDCEMHELPGIAANLVPEPLVVPQPVHTRSSRVRGNHGVFVDAPFAHNAADCVFRPGGGSEAWFKHHEFAPEMIVVPAGQFVMGSSREEIAALRRSYVSDRFECEAPQTRVTIRKPFAMARYVTTRREWLGAVSDSPDWEEPKGYGLEVGSGDVHPATCVSWNDVTYIYLRWLRLVTGKSYRLPSEAEWEFACRAGTKTPYWCGGDIRKTDASFGEVPGLALADEFHPNPWGLYQMHGNVWEWCQDQWQPDHNFALTDGGSRQDVRLSEHKRVVKGGSWRDGQESLRSAAREAIAEDWRDYRVGFRVVLDI